MLLLVADTVAAQDSYYYFDPDQRGAHAFYNPWNFIAQGGLGAIYQDPLDTFDWIDGFVIVNESLTHPVEAIGQ